MAFVDNIDSMTYAERQDIDQTRKIADNPGVR
jgi:hypothetical protein